jgi:hypothetical protein
MAIVMTQVFVEELLSFLLIFKLCVFKNELQQSRSCQQYQASKERPPYHETNTKKIPLSERVLIRDHSQLMCDF